MSYLLVYHAETKIFLNKKFIILKLLKGKKNVKDSVHVTIVWDMKSHKNSKPITSTLLLIVLFRPVLQLFKSGSTLSVVLVALENYVSLRTH
jgi:hypothetical protein